MLSAEQFSHEWVQQRDWDRYRHEKGSWFYVAIEEILHYAFKQYSEYLVLSTLDYPDYLKTDYWLKRRSEKLRAAGFRCQLCGQNSKALQVHHNNYERRGIERDEDLIVLCRSCHKHHHQHDKPKKKRRRKRDGGNG